MYMQPEVRAGASARAVQKARARAATPGGFEWRLFGVGTEFFERARRHLIRFFCEHLPQSRFEIQSLKKYFRVIC